MLSRISITDMIVFCILAAVIPLTFFVHWAFVVASISIMALDSVWASR